MSLVKYKITLKFTVIVVMLSLFTATVTGLVAFNRTKSDLQLAAESKLLALLESREKALDNYLQSLRQNMQVSSESIIARKGLIEFTSARQALGPEATIILQRLYIHDNPHQTGRKEDLDRADDSSEYSTVHGRYHPVFRKILRQWGYYDIFLISPNGDLVYTVYKELDYATNLITGPWKDTDLGKAFRIARDNPTAGFQTFFDFKPYAPSHGKPASFIASPVLDESGVLIGVIAFQMPIGRINDIMHVSIGMGESGETYIVGDDMLMRSDSRFSETSTILKTRVDTETVRKALAGESGVSLTLDYRGIPVLSAFTLLHFMGANWAIMAEIDHAEVLKPVYQTGTFILITSGLIGLLAMVIGIFFSLQISRPIQSITAVLRRLAENDLEVQIPVVHRQDEIGELVAAANVFKQNAVKVHESEEQYRTLVSNIPGIVYRYFNQAGQWQLAVISGEIENISGYPASEFMKNTGLSFQSITHPDDIDMVIKELLNSIINNKPYELEYRILHTNGEERWVYEKGQPIFNKDNHPAFLDGTIFDITQRKLAEEKIRHLANHDELTGLPTLRLGKDRLSSAIALARRNKSSTSVLFLDLDGFKAVNDNWGHKAGDHVLKEVAVRLMHCVRETDTVARIGGDEFIIVVTQIEENAASIQLAERVIESLVQPIKIEDQDVIIGTSIGIAHFPEHGETPDELIKKADEAMYGVKRRGKNNYAIA